MADNTAQYITLEADNDVFNGTAHRIYNALFIDVFVAVAEALLFDTASAVQYYIAYCMKVAVLLPMHFAVWAGTAERMAELIAYCTSFAMFDDKALRKAKHTT